MFTFLYLSYTLLDFNEIFATLYHSHTLQVQQFSDLSCYSYFMQQNKWFITQLSFCLQILKEDLYVNVNFASTFLWKSIILFMSFSKFEFKWPVHVIDAYSPSTCWFSYCFTFEVNNCDWIWKPTEMSLGLFHFIGPAGRHTYTLPVHCCITRLSWLVCSGFSRAGFADHVKSWLRQWGSWRALDGRHRSDIHPCVSEVSFNALQACLSLWLASSFWTHSYSKQSCWKV